LEDPEERWKALARARIVADPRKFRDYVLVPGHSSGKARIFLQTLGYRPRSNADAWALARLYEEQARAKIVAGDIQFGEQNQHGLRCTIEVVVRGVALRTGWRLRENGTLWLATPFSGFARIASED
jgi:glyoxylase-like metal-dependent hydrolase (beta-lactamase superfamily II)